jgi:hypothetical protein
MPNPTKQPEPLYIADKKEGFLNWLAECIVERVIREVEAEQAAKVKDQENTIIYK